MIPTTLIPRRPVALEQLEAEKQRRIQARIDAGQLRVVGRNPSETLVVGSEEETEEVLEKAKAAALAKYGNVPPLHFDYEVIVTGVVRDGERYSPDAVPRSPRLDEEAREEAPVEEPVGL